MKADELLEEMAACITEDGCELPRELRADDMRAALRVFVEKTGWYRTPGGGLVVGTHMDFEETVYLLLKMTDTEGK